MVSLNVMLIRCRITYEGSLSEGLSLLGLSVNMSVGELIILINMAIVGGEDLPIVGGTTPWTCDLGW